MATPELSRGADYQSTDYASHRLASARHQATPAGVSGEDRLDVPKLYFLIDLAAPPLRLAAQALAVIQVQEYAAKNHLAIEEREGPCQREYVLGIPADSVNDTLWALDLQGLLYPNQRITGHPDLHATLEERFSWLEWADGPEEPT